MPATHQHFGRKAVASAAALCLWAGFAGTANARLLIEAAPLARTMKVPSLDCRSVVAPSAGAAAKNFAPAPTLSKSSTILGGQVSALDRIRQQQSATTAAADGSADEGSVSLAIEAETELQDLSPAAAPFERATQTCDANFVETKKDHTGVQFGLPRGNGMFLASKRTEILDTPFDDDWRRVSQSTVGQATLKMVLADRKETGMALLSSVNSWVNRNIAFAEDRNQWRRRDYWASANVTLALRRGDCEDYAIAKMQLLAAAGIDRNDMYLTVARDLVRNADHALLIVRIDGRFYVLDNNTDQLLDGAYAHDYRPVISYNGIKKWLHGY